MKKFLRNYPQILLITLAILFLAIIVAYFSWGMGQAAGEVNRAVNAKGSAEANVNFNLQGAKQLDLRGLVK